MKTKRVITAGELKCNQSTSLLNFEAADRAVLVGRKMSGSPTVGLLGKVSEAALSSSVLDAGVWLDLGFPHVIGIFGSRGSGKSFDLGVIAEAVSGLGPAIGSPGAATLIFDVQDQFWTLSKRPDSRLQEDSQHLKDLDTWGIAPAAAENVTLWAPPGYKTPLKGVRPLEISPKDLTADDWFTLLDVERFSSQGQILLTLLRTNPSDTPQQLARRCMASELLHAFQNSSIEALKWRLESLAEAGLIGSAGLHVEEFLKAGKTSVVLMRQIPESLRALLVGVMTRLLAERMSYFHQQKRVLRREDAEAATGSGLPSRLWIFLDEAHVIVPSGGRTPATEPIIDYVKRGRDAGLSFVFATQQPSAVDARLMSQVDLTLTHYLGFDSDLQAALARMPTLSAVTYDMGATKQIPLVSALRLLKPGECAVADAANGRVFLIRVRPRVSAHGGNTPS